MTSGSNQPSQQKPGIKTGLSRKDWWRILLPEDLHPSNCTEKAGKFFKDFISAETLPVWIKKEQDSEDTQGRWSYDKRVRNWSGAVRNYRSPRPRGARKRQRVILADVFPGSMPLLTLWLQTPGFQNYESINLCCANLPSSWSFCRATQGNEHNKHSTQYVLHSSLPVVGGKYWATQRNCRTSVPSWNVWKFRGDVVLKKKKF